MATQYRTRAFIFGKTDRNESDRYFSVFTENFGRLDVYAKAIRKITSKLRSEIDIFYLSEIEFVQGKNHKTLTDSLKIKKFSDISVNFDKLKIINKISKLLNDFIKGQEKDIKTFDLLIDFLDNLESSKKIINYNLAYQYFFWNFISLQGYRIEVNVCATCRTKLYQDNIYFSAKDGGAICKKCLEGKTVEKINSDVIKVLRLILKEDWQTISRLKMKIVSQDMIENISESAIHFFCPANS
jgi:DNA repair protein RecO (recombination protein O)